MSKTDFVWWPYRVLALLVPAISFTASALTAAYAERSDGGNPFGEWLKIFGGVLGAGNGYLLGIASGDLKRALIATIVGAAAGFFALTILALPGFALVLTIVLLGGIGMGMCDNTVPHVAGYVCVSFLVLVLIWVLQMTLLHEDRFSLAVPFLYPFVCGAVGGAVADKWTPEGILGAMVYAFNASVLGILCTLPVWILSAASMPSNPNIYEGCAFVLACLLLANYVFIGHLFTSIRREDSLRSI